MNKTFIISEIAQSYEGDLDTLCRLVKEISKTGTDAIMFQVIEADEIATKENNNYNFFKSLELKKDDWKKVISLIQSNNTKAVGEAFGKNQLQ